MLRSARPYLALLVLLLGCSEPKKRQTIQLRMTVPSASQDRLASVFSAPSALADIDCVGLFVGYPTLPGPGIGQCTSSLDGPFPVSLMGGMSFFDPLAGPGNSGGMIIVDDVLMNENLDLILLGFRSPSGNGDCVFLDPSFDPQSLGFSQPFILDRTTTVLSSVESTEITMMANFNSAHLVSNCNFNPDFSGGNACVDPGYPGINQEFINCLLSNGALGPWVYPDDDINANDVFVMKTSLGHNTKFKVNSFTGGLLDIDFETFDNAGALIASGSGVSVNANNRGCSDFDIGGGLGPCDGNSEIQTERPDAGGPPFSVIPLHSMLMTTVSAPNGNATQLRLFELDGVTPLPSGATYTRGECKGFLIGSVDQAGTSHIVPAALAITPNFIETSNTGSTVDVYTDNACASPLGGDTGIAAATATSPALYLNVTGGGGTVFLYLTVHDTISGLSPSGITLDFN